MTSDTRPRLPARRAFLATGAATTLALAGCGFKLREAPEFAFKTIAMPSNTPYLAQLRRAINVTGKLQVLPIEEARDADVVFSVLGETREQVVLSTNSAGQVREMQLYLRVRFKLVRPTGQEVISLAELQQSRDITYNETAALAKEGEMNLLYRDMTNDVVQQTVRRLGAVKAI